VNHIAAVRGFWQAFNTRDWRSMLAPFAPDFRFFNNALNIGGVGLDEWARYIRDYLAAFPDVQLVDHDFIDAGETLISMATNKGTDSGLGFAPNLPPTGRVAAWRVCYVWSFDRGGSIVSGEGFSDMLRPLLQLGHVTDPVVRDLVDVTKEPTIHHNYRDQSTLAVDDVG
jgi:hypothetical protein